LLFNEARNFRLSFAIGHFIWNLSGSDEIEPISFYNGRGSDFSDDGKTVYGSAYWRRISNPLEGGQLRAILEKIARDPSTRRSFAAIFQPIDNLVLTRDLPCPIGVQYLMRENKLFGITYMRSNSAALVMPYNVFFFTMLQELLAKELGVEPGDYVHVCSSLHYYVDEESFVDKVLASKPPKSLPMKPMSDQTRLENIADLVAFEKSLRLAATSRIDRNYWLNRAGKFDPYWTQIAYLLVFNTLIKMKQLDDAVNVADLLDREYKFFATKHLESQFENEPSAIRPSINQ